MTEIKFTIILSMFETIDYANKREYESDVITLIIHIVVIVEGLYSKVPLECTPPSKWKPCRLKTSWVQMIMAELSDI